jgi:signal transduction histidine kinase
MRQAARVLAALWFFAFWAPGAVAQAPRPFDVGRARGPSELQAYVTMLEDERGTLTFADVQEPARAGSFSSCPSSMTFGFKQSALWLKLKVTNSSAREQSWLLEAAYPLLDHVTLYVVSPDGRIEVRETGDMHPFSTHEVADPNFTFRLLSPPHAELTYFVRVQTSGSLRVPLVAWKDAGSYFEHHNRHNLVLWMFYGALGVMVLFNFAVYLLISQREYLTYTSFLIGLWAVQFTLAGHTAQVLLPEHPLLANKLLPVAIALVLLLIPVFANESFAQFSEFASAARVARRCLPFTASLLLFACVASPGVALRGTLLAALLLAASAPFLLRVLRRQRNPQLHLYFMSWYCVAVAVPVYVLRTMNVIPPLLVANWSIQIGITLHGVITSLALAARLKVARDQLGMLNGQLSSNVSELKLALARAEQATDEARRAMQIKGEFMATMSHELRTPLNTIINVPQGLLEDFAELRAASCDACGARFLLDPGEAVGPSTPCADCAALGTLRESSVTKYLGDPEHTARFLHKIERSGKHLLQMVNGVLDFSKMEAGRFELSLGPLELEALLREGADEMADLAQRKHIQLELQLDGDGAPMLADPLRLKQVLLNLLANAIKFSEPGGKVTIAWRSEAAAELISVSDRGIGIAPEDHERIFTSFEQVHRGDTRKYGGTGLGLSISRSLVRMHGGELWVESALGEGSTFSFRIPRQPRSATAALERTASVQPLHHA